MKKGYNQYKKILLQNKAFKLGVVSLAVTTSGCTLNDLPGMYSPLGSMQGYDRVTFETASGMNADADRTNGVIRTAKEAGRGPSKYFDWRKQQEPQVTARENIRASRSSGLFSGLFGARGGINQVKKEGK